jgi:hypothetical protein
MTGIARALLGGLLLVTVSLAITGALYEISAGGEILDIFLGVATS